MCGRFALEKINLTFGEAFGTPVPECAPRYNIAPSQPVVALMNVPESSGASFHSLSILTTAANAVIRPIHDRMPVILQSNAWRRWLDPAIQHPREIADLLTPCDDGFLTRREVGTYVNNARHEGELCMAPVQSTEHQSGAGERENTRRSLCRQP